MKENLKEERISQARGLAKWLELDFSIKIFGVEIVHWHFPPKKDSEDVD